MRRIRATGSRVLVAALDADQYEDICEGGEHVRYEIDESTGLAMAPDRVLPHMGVVMTVGPRADVVVSEGDRVVMQRAKEGHRHTFLWGSVLWQSLDGTDSAAVPASWNGETFETTGGRVLVRPVGVDPHSTERARVEGLVEGVVVSSRIPGVCDGDAVWFEGSAGVRWTTSTGVWVSLDLSDVVLHESHEHEHDWVDSGEAWPPGARKCTKCGTVRAGVAAAC